MGSQALAWLSNDHGGLQVGYVCVWGGWGGDGEEDVHIHHVRERTQGWRKWYIKTFEEKKSSSSVLTPYVSPFLSGKQSD